MQKFRKAQAENKISIERHLEANALLDSSSDEEEEGTDIHLMVDKVLSVYKGEEADTEKVLSFLINNFQSGGAVCLICISTVKNTDPIWNCNKCYCFLHLTCILHWIRDSLGYKREKGILPCWACPKCRMEYGQDQIPQSYECFCKKTVDPPYQPWAIPHSCGETCDKLLQPECGHRCVLLCHPGPCPPCAKTISIKCYCGKQPSQLRRCNTKGWSCGSKCQKKYKTCLHLCNEICHSEECPPCSKIVLLDCNCENTSQERKCWEGPWTCDRPCNKLLSCKVHVCEGKCHAPGDCGKCPTEQNRTCPCGKKRFAISCTVIQNLTCGDTCGKLLDCGSHFCSMRCHIDRCGQCLEVTMQTCRCGSYKKELPCGKEFHCNKKCTQMRLCGRHTCNKKCCDCPIKNTFNVCEKVCDNTLNCRKHKCSAPCHSGPCYPCPRTEVVQCRCGKSKITVPCGTTKKIKPPPCNKVCKIPPICHHAKRETHKCHQGHCPPCKKICGLVRKRCGHSCTAICHTKVWMKVSSYGLKTQPAGPWEKQKETMQLKTLPCPLCEVSVPVTCNHEVSPWPCHLPKPKSCGRVCGEELECTNHTCTLICHKVRLSENKTSNVPCMECEEPCSLPRPTGCTHACPKPCHPAPCSPCKQLVKVSCHCRIGVLYRRCIDLTSASAMKRNELLKCGNQCPKNYPCGHRCMADCHPGLCKNDVECNRKVSIWCKCKRIKKDFICSVVQKEIITVECDDICKQMKMEREQAHEAMIAQKRHAEEMRNQMEIEKFERKFKPRRKGKDKFGNRKLSQENTRSYGKYWIVAFLITVMGIAVLYLNTQL